MIEEYRFIFEKGSRKNHCPQCNKKTFVKYIDTATGEHLPPHYGRCDRDNKCGYYLNPYKDGYLRELATTADRDRSLSAKFLTKSYSQNQPKPVFFDTETYDRTLDSNKYPVNSFVKNLLGSKYALSSLDVNAVVKLYRLGTVARGYRAGSVTFPFIDVLDNIRAVQVKNFDSFNRTTSTDFLHSIMQKHYECKNKRLPVWLEAYINQEKRITCLFGEHLLQRFPMNPVALVEAPKTAIYGTLYFGFPENADNFIWLAVYNRSSFSMEKLKVLRGREVTVFPDLSKDGSCYNEWKNKAAAFERLSSAVQFKFSDILERLAPEEDRVEGYDLADYLVKHDWRLFRSDKF